MTLNAPLLWSNHWPCYFFPSIFIGHSDFEVDSSEDESSSDSDFSGGDFIEDFLDNALDDNGDDSEWT